MCSCNGSTIVPSSPTPIFDGNCGRVFETTLTSDAALTVVNAKPGIEYVFSFAQDATGGHALAWPTNVINASAVDPVFNSVTVQSFVCRGNGSLYPVGPSTQQ